MLNRKLVILTGAVLTFSLGQSAFAKTTHLVCSSTNSEATTVYEVTLNEDNGEVVYSNQELGSTIKKDAIFTADKVMWGSSGDVIGTRFVISRVDLSFSVEVLIGGESVDPGAGSCSIAEAPKTVF